MHGHSAQTIAGCAAARGGGAAPDTVFGEQVNLLVSYTGSPLTVKDLHIVLDKRVYKNFVGRWSDVIGRVKWDVTKSVVKSVAGLQRSKVRDIRKGLKGMYGVDLDAAEAELLAASHGVSTSIQNHCFEAETDDDDCPEADAAEPMDSPPSQASTGYGAYAKGGIRGRMANNRWAKVFGRTGKASRTNSADQEAPEAAGPLPISDVDKQRMLLGSFSAKGR